MRLLKCSIQNFGTLSDFTLEFDRSLTVINQPNGFGKTTLAAFLKAMLYGLPQTTKKKIIENERMRYTPWQGGVFGGWLEFESGGKHYRIERSFAEKERDDRFKLFDLDTGAESSDFSENIGVELFGIDANGFERSVFMPQQQMSTGITADVRAKLTGLVENDDLNNYDSAMTAISNRMKWYCAVKGKKGAIFDKQHEIDLCRKAVADGEASLENLKEVSRQLADLRKLQTEKGEELERLRKEITAVSDYSALKAQEQQRQELSAELNETELSLNVLKAKYPNGFPNGEELTDAKETLKLKSNAETELALLSSAFTEKSRLEELEKLFCNKFPSEQELELYRQKLQRIRELESRVQLIDATRAVTADKKGNTLIKLTAIAAAGLLIGGVGLAFFKLIPGLALALCGLLCVGAAAFLHLKGMISNAGRSNSAVQEDYQKLLSEKEKLQAEADEFLSAFGVADSTEGGLDSLRQAALEYTRLKQAFSENQNSIEARKQRISECNGVLNALFGKFCLNDGLEAELKLTAITRDAEQYSRLNSRHEVLAQKLSFLPKEKLDVSRPEAQLDRELLLATEKKLLAELDKISDRISVLNSESEKLSLKAEQVHESEEQLDTLQSGLEVMTESQKVLELTQTFLTEAKSDLSRRYLGTMTEAFKHYIEVLGVSESDLLIDTDLTLKIGKNGALREKDAFSAGVKDMLDIAMRLSLADAMFGKEGAMLILDDPFVNLDDSHLGEAMALLKRLAESKQIVYLTCHSSRC